MAGVRVRRARSGIRRYEADQSPEAISPRRRHAAGPRPAPLRRYRGGMARTTERLVTSRPQVPSDRTCFDAAIGVLQLSRVVRFAVGHPPEAMDDGRSTDDIVHDE